MLLAKTEAVIDNYILDKDDYSIVTDAVHMSGSISQALAAILSQHASKWNRLSAIQKKESPMEAAITVAMDDALWRSFDCSIRLLPVKVEGQSKCSMESSKDNRVSTPLKRSRNRLLDDCDSSQEEKQFGLSYSDILGILRNGWRLL